MGLQSSFNKIAGVTAGAVKAHQLGKAKSAQMQQQSELHTAKMQLYNLKIKQAQEAVKARQNVLKNQREKKQELYVSLGGQQVDISKLPKETQKTIKKEAKKK